MEAMAMTESKSSVLSGSTGWGEYSEDIDAMGRLFEKTKLLKMNPLYLKVFVFLGAQGTRMYTLNEIAQGIRWTYRNKEIMPQTSEITTILNFLEQKGIVDIYRGKKSGSLFISVEPLSNRWGIQRRMQIEKEEGRNG